MKKLYKFIIMFILMSILVILWTQELMFLNAAIYSNTESLINTNLLSFSIEPELSNQTEVSNAISDPQSTKAEIDYVKLKANLKEVWKEYGPLFFLFCGVCLLVYINTHPVP